MLPLVALLKSCTIISSLHPIMLAEAIWSNPSKNPEIFNTVKDYSIPLKPSQNLSSFTISAHNIGKTKNRRKKKEVKNHRIMQLNEFYLIDKDVLLHVHSRMSFKKKRMKRIIKEFIQASNNSNNFCYFCTVTKNIHSKWLKYGTKGNIDKKIAFKDDRLAIFAFFVSFSYFSIHSVLCRFPFLLPRITFWLVVAFRQYFCLDGRG